MSESQKSIDSVLIIGGGVVGLTSAYYLSKAGWNVTLVDKGDLTDNCSYGNAGMIVPSHFTPMAAPGMLEQGIKWMFDSRSPFYVKPSLSWNLISWGLKFMKHANEKHVNTSAPYLRDLHLYSDALYKDLAQELGASFELSHKGILMMYKTEATAKEEIHLGQTARNLGLDVVALSKEEVQALEPNVELDVIGAVHYRCDGHLYPQALMAALIDTVTKQGVTIIKNQKVVGFTQQNGAITTTHLENGQTLSADKVVVTGGAWMGELAKKTGVTIPMMPGKGYSFMTDVFDQKLVHPSLLLEARVAVTPMGGKVRIGGTMELAAVNHEINVKRLEGIVRSVPQYYKGYNLPLPQTSDVWHGFRPCSADGLPYLGASKQVKNLVFAGGLGMMGLSLGPATGKTVAELVMGQKTSADISIFDPERFN
jgi:D-amino-acid dehydrogenase